MLKIAIRENVDFKIPQADCAVEWVIYDFSGKDGEAVYSIDGVLYYCCLYLFKPGQIEYYDTESFEPHQLCRVVNYHELQWRVEGLLKLL